MLPQQFGGPWTEEKLGRLRKYLNAYTTIFTRNVQASWYKTIYLDAFAGSGYRTPATSRLEQSELDLFADLAADPDATGLYEGSPRIALGLDNPFSKYIFIENNPEHASMLERLTEDEFSLEDRAMSTQSKIEWTERTWNPIVGCTKISQGCKHCYAETMALRLQAMGVRGYEDGFQLTLMPERLNEPLERRKPTVYFVNSMSDLFHEKVPFSYMEQVFDVMRQAHQHTFQVLTKRAERMARFCRTRAIPDNVWLGVSVENRKQGVPRIDFLRRAKAGVRFLSIEPLLEDLGRLDLRDIQWVIVGGESGKKARPMQEAWVANVKRQCDQAGIAFFFKQWGAWGADGQRRSKRANGRHLGGRVWDDMPASAGCV